jgi:hypothetical protein
MSMLMQLLIGREIAKRRGIEDNAGQMRVGALAAVVPSPVMGLVVATVAADRAAPVPAVKPQPGKPAPEKPAPEKPAEAGAAPPPTAVKGKA